MFSFIVGFPRVLRPFVDGAGEAGIVFFFSGGAGFLAVFLRAMLLGVVFAIPRFVVLLGVGFLTGFLFFLATGVVVVFLRGLFASLIFRWCCPGNGATFFFRACFGLGCFLFLCSLFHIGD